MSTIALLMIFVAAWMGAGVLVGGLYWVVRRADTPQHADRWHARFRVLVLLVALLGIVLGTIRGVRKVARWIDDRPLRAAEEAAPGYAIPGWTKAPTPDE